MMPPVIDSWLNVMSRPRRCAGASSLMKSGVTAEERPTAAPETKRVPYSAGRELQNAWSTPPTQKHDALATSVARRPNLSMAKLEPTAPSRHPRTKEVMMKPLSQSPILGLAPGTATVPKTSAKPSMASTPEIMPTS